jgi:hypothetical protein
MIRPIATADHDARGAALIETLFLGLLLLVPLLWALGVLADLHRGALATTAAAREAGRDAARSSSVVEAETAVEAAVRQAFADTGLDPLAARVTWSSGGGLKRGDAVEVEVGYPVTVVQAPLLGRVAGPSIWVTASHAVRVDPFASRE